MSTSPVTSPVSARFMRLLITLLAVASSLVTGAMPAMARSFVAFESGQVRPVAMTPDGAHAGFTTVAGKQYLYMTGAMDMPQLAERTSLSR